MGTTIAVLGSNGFIGSAIVSRLAEADVEVRRIQAPRLRWPSPPPKAMINALPTPRQEDVERLAEQLDGAHAVINAAGIADADAPSTTALYGANSLMPLVAARAAAQAGAVRFVHLSSIVVQGTSVLDETARTAPFSPYSLSRALGERMLLQDPQLETVVYRPTPIQGAHKPNTKAIVRIARSPLACVGGDGTLASPQALVEEVSSAIALTTLMKRPVPPILLHPHNGMTTGLLLRLLGNKEPRHLPLKATRIAVDAALAVTRKNQWAYGNARRLEMLLLGRHQASGWLAEHGFSPTVDHDAWRRLGRSAGGRYLDTANDARDEATA
jgi:dTDP-4-dehydrorhamnose reductase